MAECVHIHAKKFKFLFGFSARVLDGQINLGCFGVMRLYYAADGHFL
jgi:hypothetical protein